MKDPGTTKYIHGVWKERYKEWKYELQCYYKTCLMQLLPMHSWSFKKGLTSGSGCALIFRAQHFW